MTQTFVEFKIWWNDHKYVYNDSYKYLVRNCWGYRHVWLKNERGRKALFDHLRGDHGYLPIAKVR